jgi:hypothetical protein
MRYRLRTLLILLAVLPPLLAYVGSYAVLSRRGYAYADSYGVKGFWFVPPDTQRDVKKNAEFLTFYSPLIELEIACGGRHPAHEPCMGPELPP